MNKFYTKVFNIWEDTGEQVDSWLRSFERPERSNSDGAFAEIVGYVSGNDRVVITIRRWERDSSRIINFDL